MDQRCSNCRFAEVVDDIGADVGTSLTCHRYPPKMRTDNVDQDEYVETSGWWVLPVVCGSNWCGEYQPPQKGLSLLTNPLSTVRPSRRTNPTERHRIASAGTATRQDTDVGSQRRTAAELEETTRTVRVVSKVKFTTSQKPRDTSIKVGAVRLKSSNTYECQVYGVRANGRRGPIKQTYGKSVDEARAKAVTWVADHAGSQEIALPTPP